jgi:hypothetical protein
VLLKRRMHSENIIHNYLLRQNSTLIVLKSIEERYPDLPNSTKIALRKAIRRKCMEIGSYYFKLRDFGNSFNFLKEAFPQYVLNWKYDIKLVWSFLCK